MPKLTPEEWAEKAKEKLKDCNALASAHGWYVIQSGRVYQIMDGSNVVTQCDNVWKLYDWLEVRMPYAYGDMDFDNSQKIRDHYANLCVPNHQKDFTDCGLTEREKTELQKDFCNRLKSCEAEVREQIKEPYGFYASISDDTPSDCQFFLADGEGDVIKESSSPWDILRHYQKITGQG